MVNEETNREDNYQGGIVVRGEEEGIFGVSVKNADEDEVNDRIDGGIEKWSKVEAKVKLNILCILKHPV